MKLSAFLILISSAVAISASPYHAMVRYPDLPANALTEALAQDAAGHTFIIGHLLTPTGRQDLFIRKVDSQGKVLASLQFLVNRQASFFADSVSGAAVDAAGNLLIVGTSYSTDFPLVVPLEATADATAAFLMKVDSQLKTILFSTKLGGKQGWNGGSGLALDKAGDIYVAGSTSAPDFPVTSGAYQTDEPPPDANEIELSYAFVTKISADGTSIRFSTLYGSSAARCDSTPEYCSGLKGTSYVSTVAVDGAGNVVIGGTTTSNGLSVTSAVLGPDCGVCGWSPQSYAGFVASFSPDGSKLVWATYLPVTATGDYNDVRLAHMTIDSAGNVYLSGAATPGLPVTMGAVQGTFPGTQGKDESGFVMKLGPAGRQILFCTYFGLEDPFWAFNVTGLAVGADGVWISGASQTSGFPATGTAVVGEDYVAEISADGTTVLQFFTAPTGVTENGLVAGADGAVTTLGDAGAMLTVNPGAGPSLVAIGNAASSSTSNTVAPFEMVTLYGNGLGPETPTAAQASDGVLPTSLAGFQVLFDGQAAPIVAAGGARIQVVVPRAAYMRDSTTLQVITPVGKLDGPALQVGAAAPGVFAGDRPFGFFAPVAKALNQDGTVNSAANPAEPGSVVTVWASGTGIPSWPWADGAIVENALGTPTLPVAVFTYAVLGILSGAGPLPSGPLSLEVLYACDAPGMVAGLTQIGFRLPEMISEPGNTGFSLEVGGIWSDTFTLYEKPNAKITSAATIVGVSTEHDDDF